MADLTQILSANYLAVGSANLSAGKYVNVEPANFEGNWIGKYANGQSFNILVSNVNGFRAKVKYQSGGVVKYQDVLIKNNAFRVGDSKFALTRQGVAKISTVMANAAGGSSLETAFAKQNAG
jgi:hypothetical protein